MFTETRCGSRFLNIMAKMIKMIDSGNKKISRLCSGFFKLLMTTIILMESRMIEGIFCMPKLRPSSKIVL